MHDSSEFPPLELEQVPYVRRSTNAANIRTLRRDGRDAGQFSLTHAFPCLHRSAALSINIADYDASIECTD
jgi:hypothetical protein